MVVILQVDFVIPTELLNQNFLNSLKVLAESIAKEPGLISKIWTENKETNEAGGIYFFKNQQTAKNYLTMHHKRLDAMGIKQIRSKLFTINEPLTAITKGNLHWH